MHRLLAAALLAASAPLGAQTAPPAAAPPATRPAPKLVVAISVDQFSADLFAQYRRHFRGGFARLLDGAVFPSGYQSHAATETCPGHSTIMTGYRPANTGIPANDWIEQDTARADKTVYCVEDERVPGSTHSDYTVSDRHLRVPTLGERMKAATPRTRTVSVAGKDRAAVLMGGHQVDELWWWNGTGYESYAGRTAPAAVARANAAVAATLARAADPLPLPPHCARLDRPVQAGEQQLGRNRFAREAGDNSAFRYSPAFDAATFSLAADLAEQMKLGQGPATDVLTVGASATDYIGHAFGSQGVEMCIQIDQLDRTMGAFFDRLDRLNVDYQVMLTADHGAGDVPERQRERGFPFAQRLNPAVSAKVIGEEIAAALGLSGPVLLANDYNLYVARDVPAAARERVVAETVRRYATLPQVQTVFTAAQILATPMPTTRPDEWSLLERVRASYVPGRSGDLYVVLRPEVSPYAKPRPGSTLSHGSIWNYDRRVPILFWRRGATGFEQPLPVETVDIMPTLAGVMGLSVSGQDGRCLDLDAGPASTCP